MKTTSTSTRILIHFLKDDLSQYEQLSVQCLSIGPTLQEEHLILTAICGLFTTDNIHVTYRIALSEHSMRKLLRTLEQLNIETELTTEDQDKDKPG